MVDWPRVDIIIITFDRIDEITTTIHALVDNLVYPADKLRILIADDFSPNNYLDKLYKGPLRHAQLQDIKVDHVPADGNVGWGGNANRALKFSDAPYVFFTEDDRPLKQRFDLYSAMALMEVKQEIGMLRIAGTTGLPYIYHQCEADVTDWLPEYREGMGLPGRMAYCLLGSGSPTLWLYSNQPSIRRRSFHDKFYGYYPEGLKLGATEESYCHTVLDLMRANINSYPAIAVQPDWIVPRFDHIGKSYQHSALDIERATV